MENFFCLSRITCRNLSDRRILTEFIVDNSACTVRYSCIYALFPQSFPHIELCMNITYLLGMNNYSNRLTPEKYLEHKEYFDQGLISCLESQVEQNKQMKHKIAVLQTLNDENRHQITALTAKKKDLEVQVYNLKKKDEEYHTDIDRLEDEIGELNRKLDKTISDKDRTIEELLKIIKEQEEQIGNLKRKEKKRKFSDTTNTNNPTGTYSFDNAVKDPEKKKKIHNSRTKSTKNRGGQPGHKNTRTGLSSDCDKVHSVIEVKTVPSGAEAVIDDNGNILYYRVQVKDAEFVTRTEEFRFVIREDGIDLDPLTMKRFRISPMTYSDHLKSQVLYLQSKGVVSLGRLCTIMNEMSMGKLNITEGTVVNWMKEFNEQSREYRAYVLEQILKSWLVHVDETGYRINGKQSWMHVMCTTLFAYFVMTAKRKDTEKGPIGLLKEYENVLMHDHYKPYYELLKCMHAECNAHILRALQGGADFDEIAGCLEMAELLRKSLKRRDELKEAGAEEMDKEEYESIRNEYLEIIDRTVGGYEKEHKKMPAKYIPDAIKVLRRMKEYANEHLLFLKDFDVEFTNNAAERQCRVIKAHKKISGQCYSIDTAEYLTSLLTVIQTANLQGINTLNLMDEILSGCWTRPVEKSTDARLLS